MRCIAKLSISVLFIAPLFASMPSNWRERIHRDSLNVVENSKVLIICFRRGKTSPFALSFAKASSESSLSYHNSVHEFITTKPECSQRQRPSVCQVLRQVTMQRL
jgi:hypothetical protein